MQHQLSISHFIIFVMPIIFLDAKNDDNEFVFTVENNECGLVVESQRDCLVTFILDTTLVIVLMHAKQQRSGGDLYINFIFSLCKLLFVQNKLRRKIHKQRFFLYLCYMRNIRSVVIIIIYCCLLTS